MQTSSSHFIMLFRLRAVIPRAVRIPHNLSFLQVNEQHVRRQAKICQNSSKQTENFKPSRLFSTYFYGFSIKRSKGFSQLIELHVLFLPIFKLIMPDPSIHT